MNEHLFSSNFEQRLNATLQLPHSLQVPTALWPDTWRGAANAYAVLIGPSRGKVKNQEDRRIVNCRAAFIRDESTKNSFSEKPFGDWRDARWGRLIAASLGKSPGESAGSNILTALWNLDNVSYGDEAGCDPTEMKHGLERVIDLLPHSKPRVIVPLTNGVFERLKAGFSKRNMLIGFVTPCISMPLIPFEVSLNDCAFSTLIIKPAIHPSRYNLSYRQIDAVRQNVIAFLAK